MELIEHLGGVADPAAPASASQVDTLLRRELARGLDEVPGARAGYDRPLVVAFLGAGRDLVALVPVAARLRNDAALLGDAPRPFLLVAAALSALLEVAEVERPVTAAGTEIQGRPRSGAPTGLVARYGAYESALAVAVPWPRAVDAGEGDAELAALAFDDHTSGVDRLRCLGAALPDPAAALVVGGLELGTAVGHRHPLDVLEVLLRAGIAPLQAATAVAGADDRPCDLLVDAALGPVAGGHRPHGDPVPARRIARRMLQMLMGKRKWSGGTGAGYHTEVTHLTRGFEDRDRELAGKVVYALLGAGLLVEKRSVGQRHVSLLSRRAADITALVEDGVVPDDLHLPPD